MSAVLQTWRLDAPASLRLSALEEKAVLATLGLDIPAGLTLPHSDLILDPRSPLVTDRNLLAPSEHQEDTYRMAIRGLQHSRQQASVLLHAIYQELKQNVHGLHQGSLVAELRQEPGLRAETVFVVKGAADASHYEGYLKLSTCAVTSRGALEQGSTSMHELSGTHPIEAALAIEWRHAIDEVAPHVTNRFMAQVEAEAAALNWSSASESPRLNRNEVMGLLRNMPAFRQLKRMGTAARLGFNAASAPAWAQQVMSTMNPSALLLTRCNFAQPTWSDYAATVAHESPLRSASLAYGGLAPLHYPAAFFSKPELAETAQRGCLAALSASPSAVALLHKQPLRYLADTLESLCQPLGFRWNEDQAPENVLGTIAGTMIGTTIAICAESRDPFLPAKRLITGAITLLVAVSVHHELTLSPGDIATVVRRALRAPAERYAWLAQLGQTMAALPQSQRRRFRQVSLVSRSIMHPQFFPPSLGEATLESYARHQLKSQALASQTACYESHAKRVLRRVLPVFTFEGMAFSVTPQQIPSLRSNTRLEFWLQSEGTGLACSMRGQGVEIDEGLNPREVPHRMHCGGSALTAPVRGRLAAGFEQYLEAFRVSHPVLFALILLRGSGAAEHAIRTGHPLAFPRAVSLLKLACAARQPDSCRAILDRAHDPLAISQGRSLLDCAIEAPSPNAVLNDLSRSVVADVAQHLRGLGAPSGYFQRSLERVMAKQDGRLLAALLSQEVAMSPEQEAAFAFWHPTEHSAPLQALVQAARMRDAIRRAAPAREQDSPAPHRPRMDIL